MLQHLGQTIRTLRKHKGITLNDLAATLHVSPGYLSNLETMKTDTVSLTFLEQIQEELNLFPALTQETDSPNHELDFRLQRLCQVLQKTHDENPELADYFIAHVEKGLELYQPK
ncbi:helix-turn-helix domain-containing protein [Bacillus cereus group sp. MYBK245-2]|uniref:Anaerobic benzoate catabolism transcriptional regulator n=1 Tax=Bacillus pacificus TaxID=2026187 RepID=A0A1Y5ZDU2_9BACI|nr:MULTISPECIES: helix-turn-helix transcriptional regulator [Bacillus cereus group]ONG86759.1 transcriptional regulator [Bacillus cereus]MDA1507888.1 helix-turn-helix transcriptional regulator [Bacillus cereus group sp. TH36-2LC]MDA1576303.1 helix-turn-helix transcriptional regulator [Bacillus cereus group sp. TH242-3LC]MDA1828963.1 helix-turn-helix transcriptional regulator [Bacillus cereus group sp. BY25LC]MDA1895075.1 helix-turn-helix transcriptional regulator [Bacillus cereus group sp. BcH